MCKEKTTGLNGFGNQYCPLLFLLPPPSHMSQELFFLSTVFTSIGSYIKQWEEQRWDPSGLIPKVLSLLAKPDPGLGDVSTLDMLGLIQKPPSSQPPTAPSLPQEELRLLRTSFDKAFALLADQVKELAAKVNGSGPPPKVAAAKKPSAQPTPKPHAQPPTAPVPNPASRPAPPSFASVVKTPARPSLVVALRPSHSGGDVPLAIRRSPQEIVTHLNAELVDSPTRLPCLLHGGQRRTTLWSRLDPTLRRINSHKPPTSFPLSYRPSCPMIPHPSPSPRVKMSSGPGFSSTASPLEFPLPMGPSPLLSASRHSWQITLPRSEE